MTARADAAPHKLRAALASVGAASFLLVVKLVVGVLSGSLAILAEAANSALDIVASLVTVGSVWYADRPADDDHPYGHGKSENLGALFQALIMIGTCLWIGWRAVEGLFGAVDPAQPTLWAFGVMVLSVAISLWRVRSLRASAAAHGSQALEADALHFYTDIFTGAAVLVGLAFVWLGERLGLPTLARADALAALFVVAVLVQMTLRLFKEAIDALLDRSLTVGDQLLVAAGEVSGVERAHGLRTRQVGPQNFVDLRIDVARSASFEESHAIASAVEEAIHELLPRADVVVHVDPVRAAGENLIEAIHAIALSEGLSIHHISLHRVTGRFTAHLHVELSPSLALAEAHARVDAFERRVLAELPTLTDVVSHIEPASAGIEGGTDVTPRALNLMRIVEEVASSTPPILGWHDLRVQEAGTRYNVSLHCSFPPQSPLHDVHVAMEAMERRLRTAIPSLGTVVIHPEPADG